MLGISYLWPWSLKASVKDLPFPVAAFKKVNEAGAPRHKTAIRKGEEDEEGEEEETAKADEVGERDEDVWHEITSRMSERVWEKQAL